MTPLISQQVPRENTGRERQASAGETLGQQPGNTVFTHIDNESLFRGNSGRQFVLAPGLLLMQHQENQFLEQIP